MELARAHVVLSANTVQFEQEMQNAQDTANSTFTNIKQHAQELGKVVAYGIGIATAAITGLTVQQVMAANEFSSTAKKANIATVEIQKYVIAAKFAGIEQDKLGDIFKDTQDKIGDFLTTGGGELKDFFEKVAPMIGITAESLRNLSGPEALQKLFTALEKANLGHSELVFYMESIADEASLLIPLLRSGGEGFNLWGKAAENAGAIMSEKTLHASKELKTATDLLNMSYQGVRNQLTKELIPVLAELAGALATDTSLKEKARIAGIYLADGFKLIVSTGIGVVAIITAIGKAIGALMASFAQWGRLAENIDLNNPLSIFKIGRNFVNVQIGQWNIMKDAFHDIKNDLIEADNRIIYVTKAGTLGTHEQINALTTLNDKINEQNILRGKTGQQIQNEIDKQKELEKARKQAEKDKNKIQPKTVNQKVLQHAKLYDYANIEKQYNLPAGILSAISMQESGGESNATSPKGAKGEFQLMPATAKRFGVAGQERDTAKASVAAAKYLQYLLNKFGSVEKAIAGYNAGEGNVSKYGGIPPFRETQNYVKNVKSYLAYMQGGSDGSYSINRSLEHQANINKQIIQQQEHLAKQRLNIEREFADKKTQLAMDYQAKVTEIKKAEFSPEKQKEYLEKAKTWYDAELSSYDNLQKEKLKSFTEFELSTEAKIQRNFQQQREYVNRELTGTYRQQALNAIDRQEAYALKQHLLTEDKKIANLQDFNKTELQRIRERYSFERREIALNLELTTSEKDRYYQLITNQERHETIQLQKPIKDSFDGLNAELSGTKEHFDLQNHLNTRLTIVQSALDAEIIAKEEALQIKSKLEEEYFKASNELTISQSGQIAGSLSSILKTTVGENSKAYRAIFAIEKSFAIARSIMAIQTAMAQASANPFPMNLGAMATVASQVANIIGTIKSVAMPVGQAHDGIMSVPKSGTWNLEAGERVLPKHTAKALDDKLNSIGNGDNTQSITVNVTVNSDNGDVQSSHDLGKNLGNAIKLAVQAELQKERRQGGLLYGR